MSLMTQLENELQNVVVSSEVNVMLNASSFSVYGFQCFFLNVFLFLFLKNLLYYNQKCAPPSQISLPNFQKYLSDFQNHLGIFQIR